MWLITKTGINNDGAPNVGNNFKQSNKNCQCLTMVKQKLDFGLYFSQSRLTHDIFENAKETKNE